MRKFSLVIVGMALAVTIAACSDLPAPRPQESGSEFEKREVREQVDPPKAVKGVVPDVLDVQIEAAADVVKEAGFKPVLDSLNLTFTVEKINEDDVVCAQDPEGDAMPAKKSEVTLVYDNKCAGSE